MKYTSYKSLAAGAMLACIPTLAAAVPLGFGQTVMLNGTTSAMQPELAGPIINDDVQTDFLVVGNNNLFQIGTSLQNRVQRSAVDGTMIFGPRLSTIFNNTSGNFLVDRLELYNFGGYDVDANYRTDGVGDRGPTRASRSADGDTLTFNYDFPLVGSNLFQNPQEDSYFLSLKTNATSYSLDGRISVFARHVDFPNQTFRFDFGNIAVPDMAPVPVPASLVMLLSAIGLGGLWGRRKA